MGSRCAEKTNPHNEDSSSALPRNELVDRLIDWLIDWSVGRIKKREQRTMCNAHFMMCTEHVWWGTFNISRNQAEPGTFHQTYISRQRYNNTDNGDSGFFISLNYLENNLDFVQ